MWTRNNSQSTTQNWDKEGKETYLSEPLYSTPWKPPSAKFVQRCLEFIQDNGRRDIWTENGAMNCLQPVSVHRSSAFRLQVQVQGDYAVFTFQNGYCSPRASPSGDPQYRSQCPLPYMRWRGTWIPASGQSADIPALTPRGRNCYGFLTTQKRLQVVYIHQGSLLAEMVIPPSQRKAKKKGKYSYRKSASQSRIFS